MKRIAIVGSSHLSEGEERTARQLSAIILKDCMNRYGNITLISGGAKGMDSIAEEVATSLGFKIDDDNIKKPETEHWEDRDGKKGYKSRNLEIAQECDILYCLPTKLKTTPCYHCGVTDHERSGACWTMKQANILKKETHLIPLI